MNRATLPSPRTLAPQRARIVATVACGVLAVAATTCRDSTGLRFGVDVTITDLLGPQTATDAYGRRVVTCSVALLAHASGNGRAVWRNATFLFYVPSRSTPLDSGEVSDTTIGASWGNSAIAADSVERSRWQVSALVPFSVVIRYRYEVFDGPRDSTQVTVPCRFNVPAGAAPTITSLTSDASSDLEPGKQVALDVSISSAVGLWQTALQLAGPCDTATYVWGDSLEHALSAIVRAPVPSACAPGVALTASVAALDANFQVSMRSIALGPLVDTTPPEVHEPYGGGYCPGTPYTTGMPATCFAGDTLLLEVVATDNYGLTYLAWDFEPAGYRDSVALQVSTADVQLRIPLTGGWAGMSRINLYARDAAGNVSRPLRDSMQVLPTLTAPAVVVPVPGGVADAVVDTVRNRVYLLESAGGRILVLSPASGALTDSIVLGDTTRFFDLTPSGDSIVTSLVTSRSLGIVDLRQTPPALTRIPLALDSATTPWYVRVTSAGSAFLLNISYASGHVYTYDFGTGVLHRRLDAGSGGETGGGPMARSYDRSVILINSGTRQRYDAATDAFGAPQISTDPGTFPALDRNGSHIAIGRTLYDGSLRETAVAWELLTALSPDGQMAYSAIYGRRGVIRSRVSDGALLDRVLGPTSAGSAWLGPDGKTLVLSVGLPQTGAPAVAVVDLTRTAAASSPQRVVALARLVPQPGSHMLTSGLRPARLAFPPGGRVPWWFRPITGARPDSGGPMP